MGSVVNVLFFASLRDDVGCDAVHVNASSTTELLSVLAAQLSPQAMAALRQDNVRIAVNQQLVEGECRLQAGDEVAFLPPVTGG